MNDYIHADSFRFQTVDDVLAQSKGNDYFAVVDIESAYRHVPVYPPHRTLQGFRWAFGTEGDEFFDDNFLCFGLANAPLIFHRISVPISRMMQKRSHKLVACFDDFLLIGESYDKCVSAQNCLLSLLGSLGFAVKWSKLISPTRRVQFLGLVIDSERQTLELPLDKVERLKNFV